MKNTTPLLSIIIPLFNTEKYIGECLDSLEGLMGIDYEVILVDDGSTDNSFEIAQDYARKNKNIRLISQENKGLGYTRNHALKISRGTYISFLDSDDKINPATYKEMISKMISESSDISIGLIKKFDSNNNTFPSRVNKILKMSDKSVKDISKSPDLIFDTIACNKIFKKSFWLKHKLSFLEDRFYEDIFVITKSLIKASSISIVHKEMYYWRSRTDKKNKSITQRRLEIQNIADRTHSLRLVVEMLEENNCKKLHSAFFQKFLSHDLPLYSYHLATASKEYQDFFWNQYISLLELSPRNEYRKLSLEVVFYSKVWKSQNYDLYTQVLKRLRRRPSNRYFRRVYMQIIYIYKSPKSFWTFLNGSLLISSKN